MGSSRFPVEVKAVGLLKHGKQKTCMLSVSWSDQNHVIIYRTFENFKNLHRELKRKFPIESGLLKKSDRTIPKFRVANDMLRRNQNLTQYLENLKLLELYCRELLKTQAKISRGEDVIGFLEAQSQDLEPAFPANSIVILPSEMGERKEETPGASSPTITLPVVSQMYRCVESFGTKDTQNRPFGTTKGELLAVLMKDRTGWWLVENNQKQIAWFPASYLEDSEERPLLEEKPEKGTLYYVTKAYRAKEPDELSVTMGTVVEVLEKSDVGWWLAWYNGSTGFIPSMFLQPYRNPHCKFLMPASCSLGGPLPNHLEAPALGGESRSAQPKGYSVYQKQKVTSGNDSCSLEGERTESSSTSETESISSRSGNEGSQGFCWPLEPEVEHGGETVKPNSGDQGSRTLSEQRNNCGFDELSSCLAHASFGVEPIPRNPPVPPRPSPREILQKCTSITRRAVQKSLGQPCVSTSSYPSQ